MPFDYIPQLYIRWLKLLLNPLCSDDAFKYYKRTNNGKKNLIIYINKNRFYFTYNILFSITLENKNTKTQNKTHTQRKKKIKFFFILIYIGLLFPLIKNYYI